MQLSAAAVGGGPTAPREPVPRRLGGGSSGAAIQAEAVSTVPAGSVPWHLSPSAQLPSCAGRHFKPVRGSNLGPGVMLSFAKVGFCLLCPQWVMIAVIQL